jgi:hypothetical protein
MRDEQKKRSRAWIWWTVLALLVLYPLSIGPAHLICWKTGTNVWYLETIYWPIVAATNASDTAYCIVEWYIELFQ